MIAVQAHKHLMTVREFFDRVLPQQGKFLVFEQPRKCHHVFEDKTQLAKFVDEYDGGQIFHACGSYSSGKSRKAENVQAMGSFFLDLDCGPGKDYPDQESAARALMGFCKAAKLPMPMVLNSGGGLHVYWPLTADVNPDEWKPVAAALKALCAAHGLLADRNCTTDSARVLRPPGTLNRKYSPPRYVSVLRDAEPVVFLDFKAAVEAAQPSTVPTTPEINWNSAQIIELRKVTRDTTRRLIGEVADWPATSENIARVRRYLEAVPADATYDVWRDCAWAVASLDWGQIGEGLIEDWSRGSPEHWQDGGEKARGAIQTLLNDFDPSRGITIGTLIHHARQHGYTEANGSCEPNVNTSESKNPQTGISFNLLTPDELDALPPLRFVVQGVLPETGLAAIYGPPASGKTFLALDLAAHIASGENSWFGRRVFKRPVVYLALEGGRGLKNRCAAWKQANGETLSPDFLTVVDPLFLNDTRYVNALIAELVTRCGADCGAVIFIDTLSKAIPGADENSAQEIGNALHSAELIARSVNGLVVIVHHSGKDSQRGLRGSSVLEGNIDTTIKVSRDPARSHRSWSIGKMKDGPDDATGAFDLDVVPLGKDEDGTDITSCAVRPIQVLGTLKRTEPRGKHQSTVLAALRDHEGSASGWSKGELERLAKDALAKNVQSKHRAARAKDVVEALINGGHLIENDGLYHTPDHPPD